MLSLENEVIEVQIQTPPPLDIMSINWILLNPKSDKSNHQGDYGEGERNGTEQEGGFQL